MAYDMMRRERTSRDWSISSMGREGDPWYWSPGAIRGELSRVRSVLDGVNVDMTEASRKRLLRPGEWESWKLNYDRGIALTGSASTWTGQSVDQARYFEAEALRWRDLVKKRGGAISGPDRPPPDKGMGFGTMLAIGGIALGAGVLISRR